VASAMSDLAMRQSSTEDFETLFEIDLDDMRSINCFEPFVGMSSERVKLCSRINGFGGSFLFPYCYNNLQKSGARRFILDSHGLCSLLIKAQS
jgi:hypothetical protein